MDRLERATRLDPQNAQTMLMLAGTRAGRRQYAVADSLFDRTIALEPDSPDAYWEKSANLLSWRGSVTEARAIVAGIPGQSTDSRLFADSWYDLFDRDFAAAADKLGRTDPAQLTSARARAEYYELYGDVLRRLGRTDESRRVYERGVETILAEQARTSAPRQASEGLAVLHAYLGDEAEARRFMQESRDARPDDRFYAVQGLFGDAVVEMLLGDQDAAIDIIASLLEWEYFMPLSVNDLRLDPVWDPLRDHPRFQQLLADHAES